jgi:hypothetical protein
MKDNPLTERECFDAMQIMVDRLAVIEGKLLRARILFAVLTVVALVVLVL